MTDRIPDEVKELLEHFRQRENDMMKVCLAADAENALVSLCLEVLGISYTYEKKPLEVAKEFSKIHKYFKSLKRTREEIVKSAKRID